MICFLFCFVLVIFFFFFFFFFNDTPPTEIYTLSLHDALPILDSLPARDIEFVAPDFAPFEAALAGTRFANSKITITPRALAGAIGRIALSRFHAGLARDPASIEPNYVRRSDAELFWKEN